jgi:AcrR family transcriptional regulator
MVVDAATSLLESEGLEGFSIRGVARSLGITPAAIYQHVPSRDRLLGLVVDRYLEDLKLPDATAGWRPFLFQFADTLRKLVLERPLVGRVLLYRHVGAPSSYRMADGVIGELRAAGFDEQDAVALLASTVTYALGFALREEARTSEGAPDPDKRARVLNELHETHPNLAAASATYVGWWSAENFKLTFERLISAYEPSHSQAAS